MVHRAFWSVIARMSAKTSSIYGVEPLFIIKVYFKIQVGYIGQAFGGKGGG